MVCVRLLQWAKQTNLRDPGPRLLLFGERKNRFDAAHRDFPMQLTDEAQRALADQSALKLDVSIHYGNVCYDCVGLTGPRARSGGSLHAAVGSLHWKVPMGRIERFFLSPNSNTCLGRHYAANFRAVLKPVFAPIRVWPCVCRETMAVRFVGCLAALVAAHGNAIGTEDSNSTSTSTPSQSTSSARVSTIAQLQAALANGTGYISIMEHLESADATSFTVLPSTQAIVVRLCVCSAS